MSTPTILIIEDDEHMRAYLEQLLARAGYQCESAENGQAGLRMAMQRNYSLVITDVIMPDKDGLEVVQQLRQSNPALPVIAISGGGRLSNMNHLPIAKKLGATLVFQKPINRSEFLDEIQKLLSASALLPKSAE